MNYTEEELLAFIAKHDEHESFYRAKLQEMRREARLRKAFMSTGCPYCGVGIGEACIVTLAPEVGPLSIKWQHNQREAHAS